MSRRSRGLLPGALTGVLLMAWGASETKAVLTEAATPEQEGEVKPARSGYADVNGIKLYHEIYGSGDPLVVIHGGLTTIGEMQDWIEPLANTRQVIAVEMQGHGRTADTDRPINLVQMGDDIGALLDNLNIPQADVVGHSFANGS